MTVIATARELNEVIATRLSSDAQLTTLGVTGVFKNLAPESQSFPYVVFSRNGGVDDYTFGNRVGTKHSYLIKAITRGHDGGDLSTRISNRIDALLSLQTLTLSQGTALLCRRVSEVDFQEDNAGSTFYHVGGTFEIEVI